MAFRRRYSDDEAVVDDRSEEPRYEDQRYDEPRYEEPRYEEPRYEETRPEAPRYEERVYEERSYAPRTTMMPWSPAQIIGLIVGIGFTVLGIVAVARTGFTTDHIYTPHEVVWRLPHSPLLALCEIGFGVLLIIASVVPGGLRWLMALLGAISLAFGIVILVDATDNLNRWLGVTQYRSGWFFTIVGAVVLLAAILSPVFLPRARGRDVRTMRSNPV